MRTRVDKLFSQSEVCFRAAETAFILDGSPFLSAREISGWRGRRDGEGHLLRSRSISFSR